MLKVLISLCAVILCLGCLTAPLHAQATADSVSLRNEDVLAMHAAQLASPIIIAKIKASTCAFTTDTKTLQALQDRGVPADILLAMVQCAAAPTATLDIPDNTSVTLVAPTTISSEVVQRGDIVTFNVARPVLVNGTVVIAEGALAFGRITKSSPGRSWGRAGKLDWEMLDVTTVDNQKIKLTFARHISGRSKGATTAVTAVATGILFPPLALLSGFTRGKAAFLPAGQAFEAFTDGGAVIVTVKSKE